MLEENDQRNVIFDVIEKSVTNEKLNTVEKQISKIIDMHPDYFGVLSNRDQFQNHEFKPGESDPFSHIALHSIVIEMISKNEPDGLRPLYDRLVNELQNKHEAQHQLMNAVFDWMIESAQNEFQNLDNERLMEIIEGVLEKDPSK